MSETTGTTILRRLVDWGVTTVYGYPGDGIGGIVGGFHHVGDEVSFVQTRHEEIAAFAACAHAKLTGEVGVCLATSGPGAIHLLNGLYDAKLDHTPVVAIVGQQSRQSLGSGYQQEVDLQALFKDVASAFVQTCTVPSQAPYLIDRAMRAARASRAPACVIVPSDVQELPFEQPPRSHGSVFSSPVGAGESHVVPVDERLDAAAAVLNAGSKVAILVGQGARGAAPEVQEVAELLGAGVAKALNGRAVLADDLPGVTGAIGLLGSKPSYDLMEGCDTLLMIGSNFPYAEWLPEPGTARGVQIDIDERWVGGRYPMEVNLVGDAAETLRALLPRLRRQEDRSWRTSIEEGVDRWWRILEQQALQEADPVNPRRVFHELSPRLPDRAVLIADSGSATEWWARHLRMRAGMDAIVSGTLASMACAVPYALAAKIAQPDRPVVAAIGDGAMQMLGMNALIDLAHHAHRWTDPTLVVVVLNNRDLNFVTWEERTISGDPKLEASQVLPGVDFAAYARLVGLEGIRVERPEELGAAWDRALAANGPVVLDVVCDPEVPPLPPHVTSDQAKSLAKALAGGDPGARRIVRQVLKGKAAEFTTR